MAEAGDDLFWRDGEAGTGAEAMVELEAAGGGEDGVAEGFCAEADGAAAVPEVVGGVVFGGGVGEFVALAVGGAVDDVGVEFFQ